MLSWPVREGQSLSHREGSSSASVPAPNHLSLGRGFLPGLCIGHRRGQPGRTLQLTPRCAPATSGVCHGHRSPEEHIRDQVAAER